MTAVGIADALELLAAVPEAERPGQAALVRRLLAAMPDDGSPAREALALVLAALDAA